MITSNINKWHSGIKTIKERYSIDKITIEVEFSVCLCVCVNRRWTAWLNYSNNNTEKMCALLVFYICMYEFVLFLFARIQKKNTDYLDSN